MARPGVKERLREQDRARGQTEAGRAQRNALARKARLNRTDEQKGRDRARNHQRYLDRTDEEKQRIRDREWERRYRAHVTPRKKKRDG